MGQKRLKQIVWTEDERKAFTLAEGGDWALSNKARKRMERERREAMVEARIAEEERRLAITQFKGMRDAVGEVEEEIELEDTTAAMEQVVIGPKKPWNEQLVERTKQ